METRAHPLKSVYLEFCLTKLLRPIFSAEVSSIFAFQSSQQTASGRLKIRLAADDRKIPKSIKSRGKKKRTFRDPENDVTDDRPRTSPC